MDYQKKSKEIVDLTDQNIIPMYNRHHIVLEKGEGVYLFDVEGKKYLDFCSGIGVYALGYKNEAYNESLKNQIDLLIHTSNLFYNVPLSKAVKVLAEATHMDQVFFTNSGAEAVEGALKLARRYSYNNYSGKRTQIISMEHSFHGRTFGALSVTGNDDYQKPFRPLVGDVVFVEYNNIESVKQLLSDKTCAIIMETVQGEGGIVPCTKEFFTEIRELCNELDIALICDEVQCGMGRSGAMFAYEQYGIIPDIVVCAKAIGGGVPVGAFGAVNKYSEAFIPGDHGTTYGGNPFVTNAVNITFDLYKKENILDNVNKIAPYLEEQLNLLVQEFDFVLESRGLGLMQGIVLDRDVNEVIDLALKKGLIVAAAHGNVIRFLPPLIISEKHVEEMMSIMREIFRER